MSRSELRIIGCALAVLVTACSSPPPASVDEEVALVDLEACVRGDAICQRSGAVTTVELLHRDDRSILLTSEPGAPARISLPLRRVDGARLSWIAIGLYASGTTRSLTVEVSGQQTVVQTGWGFARVEVFGDGVIPEANARLDLSATSGAFHIAWVVGRWKR